MDDTFRLVFVWPYVTPSAESYAAPEALPYANLRDAVMKGHDHAAEEGTVPYISYKHMVLDPFTIELIYRQFVADGVTA